MTVIGQSRPSRGIRAQLSTLTWYWSRGAKAPHPKTVFGFPNDVSEVEERRAPDGLGSSLP